MRSREEIQKEIDSFAVRMDIGVANLFTLEVLLDIRDLLLETRDETVIGMSDPQIIGIKDEA